MRNKRIAIVAGLSLAVVIAALSVASNGRSKRSSFWIQEQASIQTSGQHAPTLSSRIQLAKARGEHEITLPAPIPIYDDIKSFDEALANYEIVVARPVEKTTFLLDPQHLTSFYRLEITETLAPMKVARCCFPKYSPKELLPPKVNEVYLRTGGGTLMLDGVQVTVTDELGLLSSAKSYLLFFVRDTSGQFAMVKLGPYGVFEIRSDESLQPIVKPPYLLQMEIERRYGSSLKRIRTELKPRM